MTIPEQAVQDALDVPVVGGRENYIRSILTAAAPHLAAVQVKKLEWGESRGRWFQKGMAPRYEVIGGATGDFVLQYYCQDLSRHPTLEDAKAAAQADHETRFWAMAEPSDTFKGTVDGDTELQAAAREAGWALIELVDEIDWLKRGQVSEIISRLGIALNKQADVPADPEYVDCECTKVQQDETCPVGYPSLLCEICDGKGVVQPSACKTCNGHGLVGRLIPWGDGEVDSVCEPCPDCEPSAGRAAALKEAAKIAFDVSENGEYHGEASVDSASSIYQQGAYEVYEAIRALHPQADKPSDDGAQGEGWQQLEQAARNLIANRFDTYKARNGRQCSIEGDDGEKCWIVSFDDMAELEAALPTPPAGEVA